MCAVAQSTSEHQGSAELPRIPKRRSSRRRESLHSPTPIGPGDAGEGMPISLGIMRPPQGPERRRA
jgi:hypothetical protein